MKEKSWPLVYVVRPYKPRRMLWQKIAVRSPLLQRICSTFWWMCAFLAAITAQAQDLTLKDFETANIAIRQRPAHLRFRSDAGFESDQAPRIPPVQLIQFQPIAVSRENTITEAPHRTDTCGPGASASPSFYVSLTKDPRANVRRGSSRSAVDVGPPYSVGGQEFSSLTALVSTPGAPSLYPPQDDYMPRHSNQTDPRSIIKHGGVLLHQIGQVNLVLSQLPDNLSVSSNRLHSLVTR